MRKFLALVLALVMTMSLVTVSAGAATDFTDDAKIKNAEAVEVLSAMGVLGGYADGSFRPEATLTRGAGAKLIAYLMLGQAKADKLVATYTVFEDVTDTVGLAPYIEWAAANGIVGGYGDGKFGPYDTLTQYAFGKMLLGVLGYDAKTEGYVGAGWQKNVYGDANYAGIFDGTETYAACTRDDAARMALGALKANLVAYGQAQVAGDAIYWNGILLTTGIEAWVDGRVESATKLYQTYGNLTYTEATTDAWGNLGDQWSYAPAKFSKFYEYDTVATYTTRVEYCDLLVALGYPVNSTHGFTMDVYYNGLNNVHTDIAVAHQTLHNVCDNNFIGGQGVLTKVFDDVRTKNIANDYVVTEVATYLAKVDAVYPSHQGTTYDFSVYYRDLRTFGEADTYDIVTEAASVGKADKTLDINGVSSLLLGNAYAKGDYALVTVLDEVSIKSDAPVAPVAGKLTGFITAAQADPQAASTYVDTAKQIDAFGFVLGYDNAKDYTKLTTTYNFFYDTYGNLIGAVAPDTVKSYLVLDAVWSYTNNLGVNAIGADVVGLDAVKTEAVNVAVWENLKAAVVPETGVANAVEENRNDNVAECYQLYTFSVDAEGNYTLADATPDAVLNAASVNRTAMNSTLTDGTTTIQLTANTQFVVRDVNKTYQAYTGYQNLPLLTAAYAEAVYATGTTNAAVVFIDGAVYDGAKVTGYIANPYYTGAFRYNNVDYYAFNLYVDGVAREVYMNEANMKAIVTAQGGAGYGAYTVQFNAVDGLLAVNNVTVAANYTENTTINYAACATDKIIKFANGAAYDLVNVTAGVATDVEVYVVDNSDFTVTAADFTALVNGANVDYVLNAAGTALAEIYVHIA